jgi:hypothetical protein
MVGRAAWIAFGTGGVQLKGANEPYRLVDEASA